MSKYTEPDMDFDRFFKGYSVPENIRRMAIAIMKRFVINGECDGMYISNVIAHCNGAGDGEGHFANDIVNAQNKKTADFLSHAYGCNIFPEDRADLEEILRTGQLEREKMTEGIKGYLEKLKEQKKTCDEYRKEYIIREINYAKAILEEIRRPA